MATTTGYTTETSVLPPVWYAIVASVSMIPSFGTIPMDGTIPGMILGTVGTVLTIITAIRAGTTGAGIITDGTLLITMEVITEAIILTIMAATIAVIIADTSQATHQMSVAALAIAPQHIMAELEAED